MKTTVLLPSNLLDDDQLVNMFCVQPTTLLEEANHHFWVEKALELKHLLAVIMCLYYILHVFTILASCYFIVGLSILVHTMMKHPQACNKLGKMVTKWYNYDQRL